MNPQTISSIHPRQAPAAPTTPRLVRYGTQSFHTADVPVFVAWLEAHGWIPAPPRSTTEYGRFWLGPRLLVCYASGTVLAQGLQVDQTLAALAELVQS